MHTHGFSAYGTGLGRPDSAAGICELIFCGFGYLYVT